MTATLWEQTQTFYIPTRSFKHTAKKFELAIEYYSQAIDLNPTVAVYYGNRSFAHLKTESYGYALADASKALELDKSYVKVGGKASDEVIGVYIMCV